MSICFQCGKRLADRVGRIVEGVTRDYHGTSVRMHQRCAETFDKSKPLSARASTTEDGHVYADNGEVSPFRTVYRKPADIES